jgi:uncharacterized protein (TIGR03083 family)
MAMSTVEERLEILKAEYQRLENNLRTLSPQAWRHPSTCDQWTVADVIAHLTGSIKLHAIAITEALQAKSATPEHLQRRSHPRMDAAATAQRGIALRQELGNRLLSEFVASAKAIEHALAQVGPDDWEKVYYRPHGAEPIRTLLDNAIAEVCVHRWDVMYPFDPQVELSHEGVAVIVERYPHRPRWWDIAMPEQHPPLPVRFRFAISGAAAPGTDFVVATPEEKDMEVASDLPAQVTFRCDAQTFVQLAYGRLRPTSAHAKGALTYEGSQVWAEIFLHSYVGG